MRWFDRPMFDPEGPTFRELAAQALSSTDRGYDLLAPKFDRTPFRTPDRVIRTSLARVCSVEASLDFCCGTGAAMGVLAERSNRVVGIDRSGGMLAEARQRLRDAPAEVELRSGDVLALDDDLRGRFDVVTCYGAFGHIEPRDEVRLVSSAWDALKPGGRFIFVTGSAASPLRPAWWIARGFNAAMRIRNALIDPPFIMYYLTFMEPRARALLEDRGFHVRAFHDFGRPFERLVTVEALRP